MISSLKFSRPQLVMVVLLVGGIFFLVFWDGPKKVRQPDSPPEISNENLKVSYAEPFEISLSRTRAQMSRVILGQLKAARSNDYAGALKFASTAFQMQYSAAEFGKMLRTGYRPVVTWTNAIVGKTLNNSAYGVAFVEIQGPDPGFYQYDLMQENNDWKVVNVVPIRRQGAVGPSRGGSP